VFLLLPTLALVHRKKSSKTVDEYKAHFEQISGLSKENLVLLSNNAELDLSYGRGDLDLQPTDAFERMLQRLVNLTPIAPAPPTEVILAKFCTNCGKAYGSEMNYCLDDGTFLTATSTAFEHDAETVVKKSKTKKDRTRANSREFMRQNFPELADRVRTSRRYESRERPNYLDDWWIISGLTIWRAERTLLPHWRWIIPTLTLKSSRFRSTTFSPTLTR
jgi:hypothetical protein